MLGVVCVWFWAVCGFMRFDFKLNVVHAICVFDLMWLCSLVLRFDFDFYNLDFLYNNIFLSLHYFILRFHSVLFYEKYGQISCKMFLRISVNRQQVHSRRSVSEGARRRQVLFTKEPILLTLFWHNLRKNLEFAKSKIETYSKRLRKLRQKSFGPWTALQNTIIIVVRQ